MKKLLANILGFSIFGLAARLGPLGMQRRPLTFNPIGHLVAMGTFGFGEYWAVVWDEHAAVILAEKRAEIAERRQKLIEAAVALES
ncbi:hypothetical protein PLICRDRAFT_116540 [Plicaturopsis crispa FD-325 SS-3]|uniref:Unplaced genomic scaffold PLICRscaffold_15, whole genome shotgun sequence n=1 Tax=Plicaturopsis crispa FD-325 SS-3 TaxID=944288 RepID=A0A0C9TAD6_PLICR|nr:hypothetical protein PLICRDRAFT_116540 [Plicaturopsis crispa FD-325 SS-3]